MSNNLTLTDEQRKAYFANPHKCPYCSSTNISVGRMEQDGVEAYQKVNCVSCGETWNDIYKLVDVE